MAAPQRLLGRFVGVTPITLFRVQGSAKVRLRLESAQKKLGRTLFDITADESDGLVHPRNPSEALFLGPNGMSMRPECPMFAVILANFKSKNTFIHEVPKGTPIPRNLVLLHEHSDHYSVQPAEPMTLANLDRALTSFLSQPQVIRMESKASFYERHPQMTPEKVGFSKYA